MSPQKNPSIIITADPDFSDLALAELRQAQPAAEVVRTLAPGVWAVTAVSFFTLAEQWRAAPPIFVRHICPVYFDYSLTSLAPDIEQLSEAITGEFVDWLDPTFSFSIQTRVFGEGPLKPFALNTAVAQTLQEKTGAILNVPAPEQIISIVVTEDAVYAGISLAGQNLSSWAGGVHRFAREEAQISRSEFKLLEALELFRIDLPERGIALDLGAAPGGWTRILRQKGQYVTAVDPGNLHPSLQPDKNVRHLRLTAETYLNQLPDQFDLIVNDMRLDARDSARLMVQYAQFLYPHGQVLMTLKLPKEKRPSIIEHSFKILQDVYTIQGARQLFHNRSEITLYLKRTQ